MKRKFITNLAFLLFLNLLVKPFYIFGIDRTIQNRVGSEEYGLYFSLFSLTFMLNILLDLGINNYNNRRIARQPHMVARFISGILALKFVLGILYFGICMGAGIILGYSGRQFNLLYILAINQFLAVLVLYLRTNISGLQFFRTDSTLSVLDRLLMIMICSVLLWSGLTSRPFQVEWFVWAQTASYGLTALTAFVIVLKKSRYFRPRIDYKFSVSILRQSFPFALLVLLMAIYNRIDSVMIEYLLRPDGKTEAGIYAQSFRILDAFIQFGFLFASLLLPIFSKMIKTGEKIDELTSISTLLIIIPAIVLIISCISYNDEIIKLLYKEDTERSSMVFSVLINGLAAFCLTYIFGTLLTANGNLRELNIMAAIAVGINFLLNLLLIPKYQALGAAIASVTTQSLTALVQIILCAFIFRLRFNIFLFTRLGVFIGLVILSAFLAGILFNNWAHGFGMIILAGILFALLLRLYDVKYFLAILKEKEEEY